MLNKIKIFFTIFLLLIMFSNNSIANNTNNFSNNNTNNIKNDSNDSKKAETNIPVNTQSSTKESTTSSKELKNTYTGNINSELKTFNISTNSKNNYYVFGEIVVVEWVNR